MTFITTKAGQKYLDIRASHTPRWVKTRENLKQSACSYPRNAVIDDNGAVTLENNGEIRQSHPNAKLLGKYRAKFEHFYENESIKEWHTRILIKDFRLKKFTRV